MGRGADRYLTAGRTIKGVKLFRAKPETVIFTVDGIPDGASWSELGPLGIAAAARACGLMEKPGDRFGLAVYCMCAGAYGEARDLFRSLRDTGYGPASAGYLAQLESGK